MRPAQLPQQTSVLSNIARSTAHNLTHASHPSHALRHVQRRLFLYVLRTFGVDA